MLATRLLFKSMPLRAVVPEDGRAGNPRCPENEDFHQPGNPERNIKGAMGEALVKAYLEYDGWTVKSTGIEHIAPDLLREAEVVLNKFSRIPDLLATKVAGSKVNPSTHANGQAFYVEVKTLKRWQEADMSHYTRFGTVLLAWVSPDGLRGCWLSKPGGNGNPKVAVDPSAVTEQDFHSIHVVGHVSFSHCQDGACRKRIRGSFDNAARTLSLLPV